MFLYYNNTIIKKTQRLLKNNLKKFDLPIDFYAGIMYNSKVD